MQLNDEQIAVDSLTVSDIEVVADNVGDTSIANEAESKQATEDSAAKPVPAKRLPSTTVVQETEVFSSLDPKQANDTILLALPSDTPERTAEALDALPNINFDDTNDGNRWLDTIRESRLSGTYGNWFQSTVTRQGSQYRQTVASERGPLSIAAPKFSDSGTAKLTGESAVLRVRALTGLGSIVQVPLWHSGFWITLKAPGDGAMLELNRRLVEEKITLGRQTYGLAFANNSVFFAGWLTDFALSHVYETTLKPEIADTLRSRISTLDIPMIIWGLACVVWPRGFPYARSVLDQSGEQNKIIREKLNIGRCLWADTSALTPWQVGHMAGRYGRNMTGESIDRYRNEFTCGKERTVKLTDQLEITLRTPSLDQYLTSGQKWVNGIVSMVDRAFALPPNDGVRNQYILDQGRATNMRQFSHWVESLSADGSMIIDIDTLEQTFDALSSDESIREAYFKGIKAFIEDATICVVAIPATEEGDKPELPRFPHLLPLDAMSVFFILLVQKVGQIQARP